MIDKYTCDFAACLQALFLKCSCISMFELCSTFVDDFNPRCANKKVLVIKHVFFCFVFLIIILKGLQCVI